MFTSFVDDDRLTANNNAGNIVSIKLIDYVVKGLNKSDERLNNNMIKGFGTQRDCKF